LRLRNFYKKRTTKREENLARIIKKIEIEGQTAVALFDTGAVFTYVKQHLLADAVRKPLTKPFHVAFGGKTIDVRDLCLIGGKIEGLEFDTDVVPVDELGRADGQELDVIIGVLTMERWEIRLDPKTGVLDLEGLKRREFTEF
jgi:predicted aspartyl protease